MIHIKRVNEAARKKKPDVISTYDQSKDDFEVAQKSILKSIDDLISEYNDFTMDVSPSNWRSTGHHLHELREMRTDIKSFKPISVEDKKIDWVRQSRESDTSPRNYMD